MQMLHVTVITSDFKLGTIIKKKKKHQTNLYGENRQIVKLLLIYCDFDQYSHRQYYGCREAQKHNDITETNISKKTTKP